MLVKPGPPTTSSTAGLQVIKIRWLQLLGWASINRRRLGSREFGAQLALPIWVGYMERVLRGVPQVQMSMPDGVSKINNELFLDNFTPRNGFIASLGDGGGFGTNEDG